jgi:hypothetical protein
VNLFRLHATVPPGLGIPPNCSKKGGTHHGNRYVKQRKWCVRIYLRCVHIACEGIRWLYQKRPSVHLLRYWLQLEQLWQRHAGVVEFQLFARYENIAVMEDQEIGSAVAECMKIFRRGEGKEIKLEDLQL